MNRKLAFSILCSVALVAMCMPSGHHAAPRKPSRDVSIATSTIEPNVGLTWFTDSDPTVGGQGVSAPLYQFLVRTDSPAIYYKSGSTVNQWTQLSGAGMAGTGLYSGALTATPRIASTGLTTWAFQPSGATITDSRQGVTIYSKYSGTAGARIFSAVMKPSPTPPYTITAYIADDGFTANSDSSAIGEATMFGWTDGTKSQALWITGTVNTGNPGGSTISVINDAAFNSGAPVNVIAVNGPALGTWLKIRDDGTNVTFLVSTDGDNFVGIYGVAKSTGYLAGNYSNVVFGQNSPFRDAYGEILSWSQCQGAGCN